MEDRAMANDMGQNRTETGVQKDLEGSGHLPTSRSSDALYGAENEGVWDAADELRGMMVSVQRLTGSRYGLLAAALNVEKARTSGIAQYLCGWEADAMKEASELVEWLATRLKAIEAKNVDLASAIAGRQEAFELMREAVADAICERDVAVQNARRERVRVVTSPRFYGEAQREAAMIAASVRNAIAYGTVGNIVDAVAQALGMRRAQS